jgi:hypothetical protein
MKKNTYLYKRLLEIRGKLRGGIVMFKGLKEGRNSSRIFFIIYLERALECGKEIFWDQN